MPIEKLSLIDIVIDINPTKVMLSNTVIEPSVTGEKMQHLNAVLTCDENGVIITANQDCELLFSQSNKQILGSLLGKTIELESVVNIQQHLLLISNIYFKYSRHFICICNQIDYEQFER